MSRQSCSLAVLQGLEILAAIVAWPVALFVSLFWRARIKCLEIPALIMRTLLERYLLVRAVGGVIEAYQTIVRMLEFDLLAIAEIKLLHPIRRFSICLFCLAILNGCSKNLTRPDARNQLEARYKTTVFYENVKTGSAFGAGGHIVPFTVPTRQLRNALPDIARLSEAGLLDVKVTALDVQDGIFVDRIAITPTEKGKPFFAGVQEDHISLVAATPIIEVLGITEPAESAGKKMCIVDFQVSWKNKQIADILSRHYAVEKKQATFVEYDDGWRLSQ